MADFNVTGNETTQQIVENGTGTVASGASLNTINSAAIVARGEAQITIDGKVNAGQNSAFGGERTYGVSLQDAKLDLTISKAGSLTTTGVFPDSIISGTIVDDSTINIAGAVSSGETTARITMRDGQGDSNFSFNNSGTSGSLNYGAKAGQTDIVNTGTMVPFVGQITGDVDNSVVVLGSTRSNEDGPALNLQNSGDMGGVFFSPTEGVASIMRVENSGLIKGNVSSGIAIFDPQFSTLPVNGDVILNTGTIEGEVNFGHLSDTYIGHDGKVAGEVVGAFGNDTLIGGAGNEVLRGQGDNDYLQGNGGNDVLDGGDGFDTVGLAGSATDYTFVRNQNGSVTASGISGQDQLIGIEQVDFLDDTEDAIDFETLVDGSGGGGANGNEYRDIPGESQCLTAEGNGVFIVDAPVAGYAWDLTQDSQGIVVWNTADNSFDILYGFSELRFADDTFPLGGTTSGSRVEDNPYETQYLTGTTDHDTFVIHAPVAGRAWDLTQDGEGIVVWDTADDSFDILYGFEELEFDDSEFSI